MFFTNLKIMLMIIKQKIMLIILMMMMMMMMMTSLPLPGILLYLQTDKARGGVVRVVWRGLRQTSQHNTTPHDLQRSI